MYHIDFILTLVTLFKLSIGRRRGRGGNQVTAFIHMYVCMRMVAYKYNVCL